MQPNDTSRVGHLNWKFMDLMVRRSSWSSWLASCRLKSDCLAALSLHIWAAVLAAMLGM